MTALSAPTLPASDEPVEGQLMIPDIAWEEYLAMLRVVGERRIQVSYDGGLMEIRMPSQRHEQAAQLLGLFVPRLAEELEIPYEPLGMTTWKKRSVEKGLESDQCYYLQNQALVREKEALDLETDPPPDLAIEVDITHSSLNRMAIYAALGVPEVWRYDGRNVTLYTLQADGRYQACASSRSFPGLRSSDVERFIESGRTTDKIRWARELREWVRHELIPRNETAGGEAS